MLYRNEQRNVAGAANEKNGQKKDQYGSPVY